MITWLLSTKIGRWGVIVGGFIIAILSAFFGGDLRGRWKESARIKKDNLKKNIEYQSTVTSSANEAIQNVPSPNPPDSTTRTDLDNTK